MAAPSLPDAAVGLGSRIGRYFSVVSVLPALFLVVWTAALVTSNAWQGRPDLGLMARRLGGLNLGGAAWLILITILVALFLHPLQLGMTRLLEGYWGSSRLATVLLRLRITRYRRRLERLEDRSDALEERRDQELDRLRIAAYEAALAEGEDDEPDPAKLTGSKLDDSREAMLETAEAEGLSGIHAARAAIPRARSRYPVVSRMMPTRLGNALRSAEDKVGKQYRLEVIKTAPHIALIAPESHLNYVDDARQQLDTSARLCVVALVVTAETVAFLLTGGWWLLLALGPYFLAYIAYRASVAAAEQYMGIIGTVLDLNRFKLYESLHVNLPRNSYEERSSNLRLMELLNGSTEVSVLYKHPAAGNPGTGATPSTPPGTP
ncbi:hypothetical protein [Amycolatopsis sp. WQ 127309]|uniref:hypothetical protein n=1 Tax=Amycolatopsis sp. WQ 127309 TaxID=2932773 RepID=UPI001FF11D58|nr:hypothetical protein [Amycolatopsis sp. WQ 127309]UOZ11215.1 hypothetical protein MUY22_24285 [Amycolatopsis sp. WQ 127309]